MTRTQPQEGKQSIHVSESLICGSTRENGIEPCRYHAELWQSKRCTGQVLGLKSRASGLTVKLSVSLFTVDLEFQRAPITWGWDTSVAKTSSNKVRELHSQRFPKLSISPSGSLPQTVIQPLRLQSLQHGGTPKAYYTHRQASIKHLSPDDHYKQVPPGIILPRLLPSPKQF